MALYKPLNAYPNFASELHSICGILVPAAGAARLEGGKGAGSQQADESYYHSLLVLAPSLLSFDRCIENP